LLEHYLDQKFKCYQKEYPFQHWLLTNFLDSSIFNEIKKTACSVVPALCSLKRSENKNRLFLTNGQIADIFKSKKSKDFFGNITGVDLTNTRTRLELSVDKPGFSLEPHIDVPEKLITFQLYISGDTQCGTDLYPIRIPFKPNTGWLIKNTYNTLHGFDKREFTKNRISLILNYVTDDWWDTDQLYNGDENE